MTILTPEEFRELGMDIVDIHSDDKQKLQSSLIKYMNDIYFVKPFNLNEFYEWGTLLKFVYKNNQELFFIAVDKYVKYQLNALKNKYGKNMPLGLFVSYGEAIGYLYDADELKKAKIMGIYFDIILS